MRFDDVEDDPADQFITASQAELTEATLQHAVSSIPFYRDHFATRPAPRSLSELPIIDADFVDADYRRFCDQTIWPGGWLTTGGTTGIRTLIPRTLSEHRFIQSRIDWRSADQGVHPMNPESGLALMLIDNNHGVVPTDLDGSPRLALPLIDANHAAIASDAVMNGFRWDNTCRPIRMMVASVTKFKTLSGFMASQGARPAQRGIKSIIVYAWHLSPTATQRLGEFWGAPISTTYGLTEANQELAIRCTACGGYHFSDAIVAEYLHPRTRGPWTDGDAEMCVSTLYPFAQVSPRLRYATRDIVRPLGTCRRTGADSFEFLGRSRHVLFDDARGAGGEAPRVIIAGRAIVDALDTLDWPRRHDKYGDRVFADTDGHPDALKVPVGFPVMSLEIDQAARTATVIVEVRSGEETPEVGELRDRIIHAHRLICPDLGERLAGGEVTLSCAAVPCGELFRRRLRTELI